MIKILVISPFSKDANSYYRCMGPMSYLAKSAREDIQVNLLDSSQTDVSWDTLCQYDILFFHRPCRTDDLVFLKIAHYLKIPVWVDYDDWLFDLPTWNPALSTYANPGVQSIMAQMIACADVITCTTQALVDKFRKVNQNVVLCPNAYRSDLFPERLNGVYKRQPILAWRGGTTHEGDLLSVRDAWPQMPTKVHFMGPTYWNILSTMKPELYSTLTDQDVHLYFKYIYNLSPKAFVFPLHDCFFNHAKSNICYIEASHAGALCVAPNLPEWRHPGVVTYKPNDSEDFLRAVNYVNALSDDESQAMVDEGFLHMRSLYDITVVNQIRMAIAHALMDRGKNPRDPWDQLTALSVLSILKSDEQKPV